jgi:hypothetical protein
VGFAAALPAEGCLLLGEDFLLARDGTLGAFARASVGLGALATDRETSTMAKAAIAADVHEALDVALNLATQVAFDAKLELIDRVAEALFVFLAEIFYANVRVNARMRDQTARGRKTDAVDVRKRNFDALLAGKIDTSYPSHVVPAS